MAIELICTEFAVARPEGYDYEHRNGGSVSGGVLTEKFPIGTAPKDGARILIFGERRLVGMLANPKDVDWHIGYWSDTSSQFEGEHNDYIMGATHWAELPS